MREAMRDGWLIALRTADTERIAQARSILEELNPVAIEELPE